jgi:hypothetical protein
MYLRQMICIAVLIASYGSSSAQVPEPAVLPDRLNDVPLTVAPLFLDSPVEFFDDFSWRSFIALNWPAMGGGAASRGLPDRSRAFGDTNGPRVWMTWKSRYEIFQPRGAAPSPWASYDGHNPCGQGFANNGVTLSSFSAFGDFNQMGSGPLVAQNHTYVRYEVRVNEAEFDSIVGHKWYLRSNLPTAATAVPFNTGSASIKAAWRILTDVDTPTRSRYYITSAQVFDVLSGKCKRQDVALVGLHIVTKTRERPQWIWSTFEHIDNVPGQKSEPQHPATIPFSFNDGGAFQTLSPPKPPSPISASNNPVPDPRPMQVVRNWPIKPQTMNMNRRYWNRPEIKGTVWQNYMLVMTQWPTYVSPESPTNDGKPFPNDTEGNPAGTAVSNTTMETYFQDMSCMTCHDMSNVTGRDFVMFVTRDAFQPGDLAPADLFSRKISDRASNSGSTPSSDPLLRSLMEFFETARQK